MNNEEARQYAKRRLVELSHTGVNKLSAVNRIMTELREVHNYCVTMMGRPILQITKENDGMIRYIVL